MEKLRPLVAVVDDEDAIRKALERLLRSAGIAVKCYASGQEFLQSLAARRPDCVVLDIRMQGMTGFDVQARLRAADMTVPIIFITALDDTDDEARAMKAGASAFLRKPFGDEALLALINTAVGLPPTTPHE
jgi:FixJ family two-component response regulator